MLDRGSPQVQVNAPAADWRCAPYIQQETALHHEFQHSGARIVEPPDDKPWGMRELLVQDLDGHTFPIAAPIR
jgi:uncharacterized glyoxalase superfamily protein PhnB